MAFAGDTDWIRERRYAVRREFESGPVATIVVGIELRAWCCGTDGVMCAFYRLDDALATAIRLQDEVGTWCQDQGIDTPLALNVGVHHGPAIAMTANGRLDYFGRTVNLAARVADQSRGGDIVVLREVLDQAEMSALDGHGLAAESFTTRLRGLASDQHLVRLARQDASTIIRTTAGPS